MRKIIYLSLSMFFIYTLIVVDENNAMLRALFISNKLDRFYSEKGFYPNDLAEISNIFNKTDDASLTSCHIWDKDIPGTGYCYYTVNDDNYFIHISSYIQDIILSSSGNYCFGYYCVVE